MVMSVFITLRTRFETCSSWQYYLLCYRSISSPKKLFIVPIESGACCKFTLIDFSCNFKTVSKIYFRCLLKKLTILSKGIISVRSYKSVCTAPGIIISSLLSPFNFLKVSSLK